MSAAIVLRDDIDVVVVQSVVGLLVLDAQVREMHFAVEVRQVVLEGPVVDLFGRAVRVAVVVATLPIALVQPALIVALELVVEDDAVDARSAGLQALCLALVGAIDLDVVFEFALAFDTVVERLAAILIAIAVPLEKAAPVLRQRHCRLAVTGHTNGLDEPLLAQVSEIAGPRVGWPVVAVAEITTGDHSEGADGGQGARLRTAKRVLAIAVTHQLAIGAARQVQLTREDFTRVVVAQPFVAVTFRRASILATAIIVMGLAGIPATASERRAVVVAIARQRESIFVTGI